MQTSKRSSRTTCAHKPNAAEKSVKSNYETTLPYNGLSEVMNLMAGASQPNTEARRTIGFRTYGDVPCKASGKKATEEMPMLNNPYFTEMIKAVNEFVTGELSGHAFTLERLKSKMAAANTLFNAEHREMVRQYHSIKG